MFKVNLLLLRLKAKDKIDENQLLQSIAWPQAGTPTISLGIALSWAVTRAGQDHRRVIPRRHN
jgi:hypothetical protein